MNTEIERKYRLTINPAELEAKLVSLGAATTGTSLTVDEYFSVPEPTPRSRYLRIRTKDGAEHGSLDYHEVLSDLETQEWETPVGKAETAREIVAKLGFAPDVTVHKERASYWLGDCEIVVDQVRDLGTFMEIEAPDEAALDELARTLLGDSLDVVSGAGYPDLIKEKARAVQPQE